MKRCKPTRQIYKFDCLVKFNFKPMPDAKDRTMLFILKYLSVCFFFSAHSTEWIELKIFTEAFPHALTQSKLRAT